MDNRTTSRAQSVLDLAERQVAEGAAPWHAIADALLARDDGAHGPALRSIGVEPEHLRVAFADDGDRAGPTIATIRRQAGRDAHELCQNWVGCEHLLLALVTLAPRDARRLLESYGVQRSRLMAAIDELAADAPVSIHENRCPSCGYDLRGTPGVVCPECGGSDWGRPDGRPSPDIARAETPRPDRHPRTDGAFFDEIRSDRHWRIVVALIACALLAIVGGLTAVAAMVTSGPILLRLVAGGVFGVGFALVFGVCAIYFAGRMIPSPRHVRIDANGVTIAERSYAWERIKAIDGLDSGVGHRVWVRVRLRGRRGFILPGPPLEPERWNDLVDALQAHFAERGLVVEIRG